MSAWRIVALVGGVSLVVAILAFGLGWLLGYACRQRDEDDEREQHERQDAVAREARHEA